VFERFTDEAREVVVVAQEESRALRHDYIGAEHLLLGLLRSGGSACAALQSMGVGLEDARQRVVEIVGAGKERHSGQIPFTPRAKDVLERALREALDLGDDHIGDEHLLFGVLAQHEGVAADVLSAFGVDRDELRQRALKAARQAIRLSQPSLGIEVPLPLSEEAAEVLNHAIELARARGAQEVELSDFRQALEPEDEAGA
jgi:ATP-dependent Clp protease ATP-binding subunit ClpA